MVPLARRGGAKIAGAGSAGAIERLRIEIEGIVQGVGFRPFVYRLAHARRLSGWVRNTPGGVLLEAQGETADLAAFRRSLVDDAPPLALIGSLKVAAVEPQCEEGFVIKPSGGEGSEIRITPDSDVCPDCLKELFDPTDRRFRYPFINCTNCGPRYTIIRGVPYDRALTTMASFPMCERCRTEYNDPSDRRFHAQPNACPECGPSLSLLDANGSKVQGDPLETTISQLRQGKIVAVKGLGGYHLAVDACNEEGVRELRKRKNRDEKPFAVMSPDLTAVGRYAFFDDTERNLLTGPERPIVLLRKRPQNPIAARVAPANGYIGTMLPYTPLHHLLLGENFTALVMTSGNISDEPVCYRDDEALERLAPLADLFLTHNREINVRTDDSVVRVFRGNPLLLRRAKGYVPRPIVVPEADRAVLAVGAELKGAICLLGKSNRAFLSQHIGDLQNPSTLRYLEETVGHLERVLKIEPEVIAHDLHPDYLSTSFALGLKGVPKVGVQHHHAHLASCMAENGLEDEVIGVILDGTGHGTDGTVWGGEFLVGGYAAVQRKGHFRPLPLPGGDAAVREPYRMALSYLYQLYGERAFDLPLGCVEQVPTDRRPLFLRMLERRINSPLTSSCGRLFDAVSALIGVRQAVSYEGQAAIELEALAESAEPGEMYPYLVTRDDGKHLLDFTPTIGAVVEAVDRQRSQSRIARSFHDTVAAAVAETCGLIAEETGLQRVVLSGGVFQNKLLTEAVLTLLSQRGFRVFTQRLAPPNDGGIALGQAVIAGRRTPGN